MSRSKQQPQKSNLHPYGQHCGVKTRRWWQRVGFNEEDAWRELADEFYDNMTRGFEESPTKLRVCNFIREHKDIERSSFRQRCTAVIVILLLFGDCPLVIDEPEGHLDRSLIANYLVPLTKEKKFDHQIIFATRNVNFVINGDAEKVYILENESGRIEIIETTIKDIENRKELLKHEGGGEAFEERGEKFSIRIK